MYVYLSNQHGSKTVVNDLQKILWVILKEFLRASSGSVLDVTCDQSTSAMVSFPLMFCGREF